MNIYSHGGAVRRRDEILRIVAQAAVRSQDDLLAALRKRGFRVTQPTLSRDLRELGLVKTPAGYSAPGVPVAAPAEAREHRLEQLVRDHVLTAEAAMNLVVLKTPVAEAQPVASAIDAAPIEDAIGTLGGDDTIFVAFRNPAAAEAFARRVHSMTGIAPLRRRARA